MNTLSSYISSKGLSILMVLFSLLAFNFPLTAQLIIPKRDLQTADSTNRTRVQPPFTVLKRGYAMISRADGHYYHENLKQYLIDSLEITGSDSVHFEDDTVCIIFMGEELCVNIDSFYFTPGSICLIALPDTTCIPWSTGAGVNIYNSNGMITDNLRVVDIPATSNFWLRRAEYGSGFAYPLITVPDGAGLTEMWQNTISQCDNVLQLKNLGTGNIIQQFTGNNANEQYNFGVDVISNSFVFGEGTDWGPCTGDAYIRYYGAGDTLVMLKDTKFRAGIRDKDGDLGTSGQVLTSTGTKVDWTNSAGFSIPINNLLGSTGTNTIVNAHQQEWQFTPLGNATGLRLSSTSTAAASNGQKLFELLLSGTNVTAAQTTYAGYVSNAHAGTVSVNYGLFATAINGTNSNIAVRGLATPAGGNSIGVYGSGDSGNSQKAGTYGVYGQVANGTGSAIYGNTTGAVTLRGDMETASTDDTRPSLELRRRTTGTASDDLGISIDSYIETDGGTERLMTSIKSFLTTSADATRASGLTLNHVYNAVSEDAIVIGGNDIGRGGEILLPGYKSSANDGEIGDHALLHTDAAGGMLASPVRKLYTNNVTSNTSVTLDNPGFYVNTSGTPTWTLPAVSSDFIGTAYWVKNRGSGNLTIVVAGGGSTIYGTSAVASKVISPGEAFMFECDGTFWNIN